MRAKKRWVIAALLTMIIAGAAFGGTVLAQDGGDSDTPQVTSNDILERTAQKLGIDAEELKTAYNESRSEIREEVADARLDAYLDGLVESGTLTEEEAEEYRQWYETRPGFLGPNAGSGFRSFGFGGGEFFFSIEGFGPGSDELNRLFDGRRFRRFGRGFEFFVGPHGGTAEPTPTPDAGGTSATSA